MPRIRSLKPGFFKNEVLCELSPMHRLLFSGLWILADREGRLEDRPRRIKAEVFPYDKLSYEDMDQMLSDLSERCFVQRYQVDGERYLCMPNFARHQLISRDEPASDIPGPDGQSTPWERPPNETIRASIYQRDNFTCLYCGLNMSKSPRLRCVDHVIPYSRGGSHQVCNLVTSCKTCNQKKWAHTPTEANMHWPAGFGSRLTDGIVSPADDTQPPVNGPQPPVNGLWGEGGMGIGNLDLEMGTGAVDADGASSPSVNPVQTFVDLWNNVTALPIPRCREVSSKRRRQIQCRLTERPLTEWEDVMAQIQASSFCRGENDRGWIATVDWVVGSPDVAVKVLEGKYANRQTGRRSADVPVPTRWQDNCPHSPRCVNPTACDNLQKIAAYKAQKQGAT